MARFTFSSQLFPELNQDTSVTTLTLLAPYTPKCRKAESAALTRSNDPSSTTYASEEWITCVVRWSMTSAGSRVGRRELKIKTPAAIVYCNGRHVREEYIVLLGDFHRDSLAFSWTLGHWSLEDLPVSTVQICYH